MDNIKYYFYIVARDYGFAPNPFYGFCTLACCKSQIRKQAKKGDWIIGLGSKGLRCRGDIIFAMEVTEDPLTFNEYYGDKRFSLKKPITKGSLKTMHGDNVYYKNSKEKWIQDDCHHNHENKEIRYKNIEMDTKVDRVLISEHFFYFGNNYLSGTSQIFKNIKTKTKKLGRGIQWKELRKEGKELINFFKKYKKKYRKNFIYGEPIDWSHNFYKKQFKGVIIHLWI